MTNERNDNGMDPKVSDAYGELADERTPDHLNRQVLRMAEKESRTRYKILRAWVRPAAWAATIGLSLVLVLELSNTPEMVPASAPASVPEEQELLEAKSKEERQDPLAKRSRPPQNQAAEKATALSNVAVDDAGNDIDTRADAEVVDADYAAPALMEQEAVTMERAEGLARKRAAPEQKSAVEEALAVEPEPFADRAAAGIASDAEAVAGVAADTQSVARAPAAAVHAPSTASLRSYDNGLCPLESRESAEEWFECIADLEKTTPGELVEEEFERFWKQYPDFEPPDASK